MRIRTSRVLGNALAVGGALGNRKAVKFIFQEVKADVSILGWVLLVAPLLQQ